MMRVFFVIFFLGISVSLSAQEFLQGLTSRFQEPPGSVKSAKAAGLLSLPFFDDFSTGGTFSSALRWEGRSVYVNDRYAVDPPSKGVATFDALDADGVVYSGLGLSPRGADTLTSLPLALGT